MSFSSPLFSEFRLPNGVTLPNRIVKAAMEENLSNPNLEPDKALWNLYEAWAHGGVGTMITGNVMVDHRAMTGPGGVVLEEDTPLEGFRLWSSKAKVAGGKIIMQINHPGRQVLAKLGGEVWAPSAVPVDLGNFSKLLGKPRAMTESEIYETIQRFAKTSQLAEESGFDGVEIHAAHGYLISQFLSPIANQRKDVWGGSLENRSRFLIEVIKAVRQIVKPNFIVSVKLNSADFQKGGFQFQDAKEVISNIQTLGVDFIELSGGNYEAPAMQGESRDGSTISREAYFLEFASEVAKTATVPILVTGGIRRKQIAESVLESGVPLVGIATALALNPNLPNHWKTNVPWDTRLPDPNWKSKTLKGLANMAMVRYQLNRLSENKQPQFNVSPIMRLVIDQIRLARLTKRYQNWIRNHSK
ncbi:NADH:flavin oxidoreductase/NADH oxidase family protein [Leptospira bandrabouensis]|uniref:NADH:flavin oxidoreductase/NADH oxidase family protein n=1 Tax=Leptospira bandrabouensis TaxID=2484903 RepID=A0A6H3NXF3_9LEPT|nr:NADH:flavin oxidoreductase/NADH oxidase family protein [Leptospira bandrabouensis]MCG6150427.1 NADH:flavin oxidoreductase/NADH oxidase family protein [Leptospira bandrabouensis]TGN05724.1 NADH:flavin oxidoreductase/NADH oxidase family protein [Leptospira bandrabouensis]TGN16056.1 NADH:flavin oxidoreductase/NADH oxidase family protein [Leptospira bandrabouensis]